MSQQVIPEEAGTGSWWSVVQTSMRTVEVVVAKPKGKVGIAVLRGGVRAGIDPFAE